MQNPYLLKRLNNGEPLISRADFEQLGVSEEGDNINGPTLVRVPTWLRERLRATNLESARYFLYFSHHKGAYIRMAWAEAIEGPYCLYGSGHRVAEGCRGALDLGPEREVKFDNGLRIFGHVASPRIVFDDENEQVILFFHGATDDRDEASDTRICQRTFVAFSHNGLDFNSNIQPYILTLAYFDPFFVNDRLLGMSGMGMFCEPRSLHEPFAAPEGMDVWEELWLRPAQDSWANPFQIQIDRLKAAGELEEHVFRARHFCARLKGKQLECYYSRVGDAPERIILSVVEPFSDDGGNLRPLSEWHPQEPACDVLWPEESWEGADFPIEPSEGGKCSEGVCQLRDPYVFDDADGRSYLLYSGQGEAAIGLAEIKAR